MKSKAAVIFPGIGYHTDKPLLYYSKKIAGQLGYEIIEVPYKGFPSKVKGSASKMEESFHIGLSQSEEILAGVDFSRYEDILFISKSVGTAVAAAYAQKHHLTTRNVYYTPVEASFLWMEQPGIVFHGTKDGWADTARVQEECARRGWPLYLTEGADHSLETGNVAADIDHLAQIMEQTRQYIEGKY